jgi:serine/threonine protein kinase
VRLNPVLMDRLLLRLEIGKTEFAENSRQVSRNTVIKAFKGDPVLMKTAVALANELGAESVESLLMPTEPVMPQGSEGDESRWILERQVGGWLTASNGLQFCVCRMQHRYVAGRTGRGKQYDLRNPATRDRDGLEGYLQRHVMVGERLRDDPHVADVLDVFPTADGHSWWVIDRWVEGTTLQMLLESGPMERTILASIMKEVLDGLIALHEADIVFRELAPQRIIVESATRRAVLTDFELAKLLDGQHSVSTDWPDDIYRAPEVTGRRVDERADLYSWARVLVHAATGTLPEPGDDQDALVMAGLPKSVWKVASDCLSPFPDDRPKSAAVVRRALARWK